MGYVRGRLCSRLESSNYFLLTEGKMDGLQNQVEEAKRRIVLVQHEKEQLEDRISQLQQANYAQKQLLMTVSDRGLPRG
jgi:hypothetical protein